MTQEREAMERLERAIKEEEFLATHWLQEAVRPIKESIEARHARSLQPITVEGLVADNWPETTEPHHPPVRFFRRGEVMVMRRANGEFLIYYSEKPCHPQPTNMEDLGRLAK